MLTFPSMTALTTGCSCKAYADAFANIDIKPSLIPYFFWNASKLDLRKSMIELQYNKMLRHIRCTSTWHDAKKIISDFYLISISLKVVSMALVFCASFNRAAIFSRMRFILTRCSVRVPVISRE